jgi:hypothetical protein
VNGARGRWRPWAAAVAVAALVAAWNAWRRHGQVFASLDDESLLLPIALRSADLATYAGDRWLAATARVFSVPYSWLAGALLPAFDDPVVALRWLSLPFHALFLAGTWHAAERIAGRAAAWAALFVCAAPPLDAMVFQPGSALPRDLVFALVPWFVVGADATLARPRLAFRLFLLLGAVANLHPLTALHAAVWLGAICLLRDPSARGLLATGVRALGFAAGAAPYVLQYLSRPAAPGAVDETVYAWRLLSMGGESFGEWTLRMESLLWIAAAAAVAVLAARREGTGASRWFVAGGAAALVLAALGPTIGRFVPALRGVQIARFERIAAWCAFVAAAAGGAALWRARRFVAVAAAAALVAVSVAGPRVLGGVPRRGPVARVGRFIDRRAGVPFEPPAPAGLAERKDASDPSAPEVRGAFLAVCRAAREATPEDALFLVPPEGWGAFRLYARRGVAVTRKEGGAALSFLGASGMAWFRDYAEAVRVYGSGDETAWRGLAQTWGASFAVVDASAHAPPGWPVVFEAAPFRVLAVPPK